MQKAILTMVFTLGLFFGYAQQVDIVSFEGLQDRIEAQSTELRIFNFWATWCKPCIEEMPYFENANMQKGVEVTFVSLDFAEELKRKVQPFIKKKNIKSTVVLLDDIDYNSWIDRIDQKWSGAIPATLFVKADGSRYFHEGKLSDKDLTDIISKMN